ncbi:protein WEAK CHLOROPLAST MOVEMENT UNDER BLUE LIGHT 1 [Manihot esculenta]|uniref:WEB family protein n=2 Tax=Manihot esculenta TaxID=3983 RepID=A0A2C9UT85_MANES|nr:protein WEAK CHLOROPLAST MOVEMENT UNDER BLUE LIGHT 1 [Manihot esculenta]
MENYLQKTGELKEKPSDSETKMAELVHIREELYRAKDNAMQSWLDSKPLIDELEKQQANLASARNRTSMSNIIISELQSQLEAISVEIRTKMEEETKYKKMINEMNQALEAKQEESELNKKDADEENQTKLKLKQVLRFRRQSLKTLQLTMRAIRIESEAFEASAAEALADIKSLETEETVVRMSEEEYYDLTRRAKEETAVAEWRITVSMEKKHEAEESRNFALSRLKELKRKKSKKEEKIINEEVVEEERSPVKVVNRGTVFPKARAQAMAKSNRRKSQEHKGKSPRKSKKKKKSILNRIRRFLVRSFARLLR